MDEAGSRVHLANVHAPKDVEELERQIEDVKVQKNLVVKTQNFEEARIQLEQRVAIVEQGLGRCDIRTTRLGTEEIVEIFYKKFNPGELESSTTS